MIIIACCSYGSSFLLLFTVTYYSRRSYGIYTRYVELYHRGSDSTTFIDKIIKINSVEVLPTGRIRVKYRSITQPRVILVALPPPL